ncbi:Copper metallochaperone, bacterial analog of Cox17 protein [plant metagenome]|uniref:Copper metallochaperone, bacterial analog of Cox17 protein n=1 Tax=plant metagenome TaxID=1297885 RepID=A0A484NZH9_9ZZZZ
MILRSIAAGLLGLALSTSALAGDIAIDAPWVRASAPGQKNGAGYLAVTNTGQAPDRLLGISSAAAGRVELHTVVNEKGVASMRPVEAVDLAPGATVTMSPGGYHIMFLKLAEPFKQGATVAATLRFERAGEVPVNFEVKPATYTGNPAGTPAGSDTGKDAGHAGHGAHKH